MLNDSKLARGLQDQSNNYILIALIVCVTILIGPSAVAADTLQDPAQDPQRVTIPEAVLRKVISKMILPKYPTASRKRGSAGVAVAEVDVDEKGNVTAVKIMEAPDEDIGQSVVKAVQQWKFGPLFAEGKVIRVHSKLTFYFFAIKGKTWVENPRKFKH